MKRGVVKLAPVAARPLASGAGGTGAATGGAARPSTPSRNRPSTPNGSGSQTSRPGSAARSSCLSGPGSGAAATGAAVAAGDSTTAYVRPASASLGVRVPSPRSAASGANGSALVVAAVAAAQSKSPRNPSAAAAAAATPSAASGSLDLSASMSALSTAAASPAAASAPTSTAQASAAVAKAAGAAVRQSQQTMHNLLSYLEKVEAETDPEPEPLDAFDDAPLRRSTAKGTATATASAAAARNGSGADDSYAADDFDAPDVASSMVASQIRSALPSARQTAALSASAREAFGDAKASASSSGSALSRTTAGAGGASSGASGVAPVSLAENVLDGVRSKLLGMKAGLEEKEAAIKQLNSALDAAKQREVDAAAAHRKQLKASLAGQKKEYEETLARNLTFIDKILKDKDELTRRCDALTADSQALETKYLARIDELNARAAVELKKARENWLSGEKVRRTQWANEQTRAIKESTVKALEPEIQRLISQHKIDLKRIDEATKEQLRKHSEQTQSDTDARLTAARAAAAQERESAVELERNLNRQRMREVVERYDALLAQQRATISAEFEFEKKKLTAEGAANREDVARVVAAAKAAADERIAALNDAHRNALAAERRTGELALAQAAERQRLERDQWQKSVVTKLNAQLNERSAAVEGQLAAQQREELELVITRLGKEHADAIDALKKQCDERIEQLKRQHNASAAEARKRESALNGQVLAAQRIGSEYESRATSAASKLAASNLSASEQQTAITKLTERVRELEQQTTQRLAEREAAFATERAALSAALSGVEQSRSEERARAAADAQAKAADFDRRLHQLELTKGQELDTLHARVAAAVSKKDALISALQSQLNDANARVRALEQSSKSLLAIG